MSALDFYNIQGKTPFHKYMDNTEMLDKLIESYTKQNPYLILCSLYKEKTITVVKELKMKSQN